MHLILNRSDYTDDETLGSLKVGKKKFATIEQPWNDNKGFISCVPEGEYKLVKHSGKRFKNTWALVNEDNDVYHLPEHRPNGKGRYACCFHAANWASQLQGCIALGKKHAVGYDKRSGKDMDMVTSARNSITLFKELMSKSDEHTLAIKGPKL